VTQNQIDLCNPPARWRVGVVRADVAMFGKGGDEVEDVKKK